MKVHSKVAMAAAVGAMVLASAAPASARGYDGRWGRYPQHHRSHDNSGAVIGAILGVGLLAAIASSASRQRQADNGYPAPRPNYDPRYDNRDYRSDDGRNYDQRYGDESGGSYAQGDENAAVDACAVAARDEASRMGGFAEVRDITSTRPFGNGWDVTGTVSQRASYSAGESRLRSFRCIWDDGRVDGVTFG